MEEETIDNKFLFLFLNLSAVLKKSIQGELAYIWHFQWIEINMTKLKKHKFILEMTFLLMSPSLMLKLPDFSLNSSSDLCNYNGMVFLNGNLT